MKRVLFICGRNQLRSPTAEHLFADRPGVTTASAGLNPDSDSPVTSDLLEWADLIFVMESRHRRKLSRDFGQWLKNKRIVCLNIPDEFEFMDSRLIALLETHVAPHLR